MMKDLCSLFVATLVLLAIGLTSCALPATSLPGLTSSRSSPASGASGARAIPSTQPISSPSPAPSPTPSPTLTATPTSVPPVESLQATVTTDSLKCRYGPGPNYLFLYGLRKGANIKLVGRTDGDNWHWVYMDSRNKCWVNTDYLEIQGNWLNLPIVYPEIAKLPISPSYPPTNVLRADRNKNEITIEWSDVPLRAGDEEDQIMQHYVVEVWHCESGKMLFEPLATNDLSISFVDEPGCTTPSHGRIFVQEKHGFSGPTQIPWPPYQ